MRISMENWFFTHVLSKQTGPFSFYTAQENSTIFLQQFFPVSGRNSPPLPAGPADKDAHQIF